MEYTLDKKDTAEILCINFNFIYLNSMKYFQGHLNLIFKPIKKFLCPARLEMGD